MKSYILCFSLLVVAAAYPLIEDASSSLSQTNTLESRLDDLKKAVYHVPVEVQQVNDKFLKQIQLFINASIITVEDTNKGYYKSKQYNIDQPLDYVITTLTKDEEKNTQAIATVQTLKKNVDNYMDEVVKINGNYTKLIELFEAANQELIRITDQVPKVKMQPLN